MTEKKKALVLIADGSEEIEVVVTVDVLRRAQIEVDVVGVKLKNSNFAKCSRDVKLVPDKDFAKLTNSDAYDIIIIPGGTAGANTLASNTDVQNLLSSFHKSGKFVSAICAGPLAIKSANVNKGGKITSYPSIKADLENVNDQVIVNILVKALTAIPNPDFNLCLYLLQESSLSDENISKLYDAQKLIEEGKYQEFWKMYETDESFKELTSEAVGFEDAIRKVIMKIISMAYQNISADLLREYLNYGSSPNDDESFKEFIKSQGLELAENNLVNIPTNIDNEAKPTVIRENIKFDRKVSSYL
ncbi:10428_t:CDS:2 [Entrophospora sp. SA101]|nr:10428_t:CDS:2 [Entrophospora sp. SA101]